MHLRADFNSLEQLRNAPAKSRSSERKLHRLSKKPSGSQEATWSMEQDYAVMTRATQGKDFSFSLTAGFCKFECTQSFKLTFPSPIPWAKQKRTFGIAYRAMTKLNNGAFYFFTFTTTFTVLFPEQCFCNSRKVSFKTTAILVQNKCIFPQNHLRAWKWESVWGKTDSPKWRQFCPTVSSEGSGIIKVE